MKVSHNWNGFAPPRNDPEWEERVEREAAELKRRNLVAYEKTQRRLARAQTKARRAATDPRTHKRRLAKLWAVVEQRRDELRALESQMQSTPAGSQNRGKGSYRGAPDSQGGRA